MDLLTKNKDNISEGSLVMVRVATDYGYSNTWWRVMFCDTDETFIGRLERHHWHEYTMHKKGDDVRINAYDVQQVYKEGNQFCYGDDITICDCSGLCRNK